MEGSKYLIAINEVPKQIKSLLNKNLNVNDVDFFILHQANKFLIESIIKRLKFLKLNLTSIEKFEILTQLQYQ